MAVEEKEPQYFSKDFEWEEIRNEVERDPSLRYHLSPFSTSPSSPNAGGAAPADAWRSFHCRHSTGRFFKERRYLLKEFPELIVCDGPICVLEVGCGNGSTTLPILRARQNIIVYACDCSQEALDRTREIVIASDLPSARRQFYPFLHDFSSNKFPDWLLCTACQKSSPRKSSIFASDANGIGLVRLNESPLLEVECCIGGIDYISLIFTLSAIPFQKMLFVITECISVLKPGGLLLFRDYGLFDMTMLRFPPEQRVGFREYIRSDGTLSYFFSLDTVRELFLSAGFIELELEYCCVISVNHRSGKKMQRVWIHGKFQKPTDIPVLPLKVNDERPMAGQIVVSWRLPRCDYFKLNVIGAAKGAQKHFHAQLITLLIRVRLCNYIGITSVWVEMDSMVIIQLIRGTKFGNWLSWHWYIRFRRKLLHQNLAVSHIPRR